QKTARPLYLNRNASLARQGGAVPGRGRGAHTAGERGPPPGARNAAQGAGERSRRGLIPAMVVASAGTANAGTIDPLVELAKVCREQQVWFHVDGAYGAAAAMTERYTWLREGFAQADSLSLDPHKWLYAPLDM